MSNNLMRSDGTYTLGVTDNNLKTVFISDSLNDKLFDKVLCHELCHVFTFENGCNMDIEIEEIVADFMSLYGRRIVECADKILNHLYTENENFF